jgi:hypothetical protein
MTIWCTRLLSNGSRRPMTSWRHRAVRFHAGSVWCPSAKEGGQLGSRARGYKTRSGAPADKNFFCFQMMKTTPPRPLGAIKRTPRHLQSVPKHSKRYTTLRHAATMSTSDFSEIWAWVCVVSMILCSCDWFFVILACVATFCSYVCVLSPSLTYSKLW